MLVLAQNLTNTDQTQPSTPDTLCYAHTAASAPATSPGATRNGASDAKTSATASQTETSAALRLMLGI